MDKQLQNKIQKQLNLLNRNFKEIKIRIPILVGLFIAMITITSKNSFAENKSAHFETRCGWLSNPSRKHLVI
ncbi:hypothetical protein LEP1GSC121_0260 [Leptospira borgpetersenii serovar Castellonis str. 200801910]|nr:hypothetical protein LEP1GSC121_0260 [Leptospira borgpetersenii serovar Castellonis str. 200801910]KGE26605.1 hypothetical protein IQ66_00155 [Leptospira borgpetersenii serovar Ballum]